MAAGCGPVPEWLVRLYVDNPLFALLVDTLAAVGVLVVAGLLLRPFRARLGRGRTGASGSWWRPGWCWSTST
jgi:hypothetical protein